MGNIEQIRQWLCGFPGWEGAAPVLDCLGVTPGSCGLFYLGLTRVSRLTDVVGNQTVSVRCRFSLRKVLGRTETAAKWLESFERWVMEQSLFSKTPVLAGCDRPCDIRAEKGRMEQGKQTGTAVYCVELTVEYQTVV